MTLCRFYQQGYCKFGSNCRFEHPGANNSRAPQTSNRFSALSAGGGGSQNPQDKYNVSAETIEKDLTIDPPQWILSAYAPGRDAPAQLFGGYPREQSFEELRLHYLSGKASGNEQQALNQAQELYQNAQRQNQAAIQNVREAANFVLEGENKHPNRHDICREGTQGAPFGEFLVGKRPKSIAPAPAQANPFAPGAGRTASPFGGASAQPTGAFGLPPKPQNPFGQPSAPAQANPFGQPQPAQGASAFGQPSQPVSAFGQPSTLGAKPNPFGTPAFGQPAQATAQGNAFGQPSQQNTQGNAFGQPSQPTQSNAFGQPPQPTQGSAFGQPSQLGQKINPFASPSGPASSPFASLGAANPEQNNASPSPFGGASNNTPSNASNPFGQPSQQTSSPFGQTAAAPPNPFAATNQESMPDASNPFLQGQQQQANGAGGGFASQPDQQQTNGGFGQPSAAGNAFGQPSANPFGQPVKTEPATTPANPFASTQAPPEPKQAGASSGNPYPPGSSKQHPAAETYISKTMDGRISSFKGERVTWVGTKPGVSGPGGTWRRIWFPDGAPGYYKDTELPAEDYDEKSKAQWAAFAQTGRFENGAMPALPPPREATRWDF